MTDPDANPTPQPEPAPDTDAATPSPVVVAVRRCNWHRVRVYSWAILIIFAFYFYASVVMIRQQPKRLASKILAQLPFPSSLGTVTWLDPSRLEFRDVKLGNFFYADSIIVTASAYQLYRHHVTEVDVMGPQLFTGPLNDMLAQGKQGNSAGLNWTITKLVIHRGTLMLDNLAPDMPSIPIRLGVVSPIILNHIKLNKPDDSESMNRERTVDLENILIVSPFDPLAPVLSFPLTRVTFTYSELWHHRLREVLLLHPILHLGQDLFWFSDEFKKERKAVPDQAQGVQAPWQVSHFQVSYGQLAINVFGQPKATLPFYFETQVDNIRLDQLDKISAKSTVAIRRLDQYYPDYKIRIVNLRGKLEFSIPPSDASANNVVPTVYLDKLAWNGIATTNVWGSVTFDPTGIYGRIGGDCESGYLKGNFEVYYTDGFKWNADFFADNINCKPIADKLAGKYFSLTGTLDGKISVQGRATEITSCKGNLGMLHPGLLEIHSIDYFMKHLPGAAGSLQQNAMKLGLESFRTYPYETGDVNVDYTPAGGKATLKLNGPRGKRYFSVYLHPYGSSKVAKDSDNQ